MSSLSKAGIENTLITMKSLHFKSLTLTHLQVHIYVYAVIFLFSEFVYQIYNIGMP